jgi:universal stress protein family protein
MANITDTAPGSFALRCGVGCGCIGNKVGGVMIADHGKHTVLVPIVGDDISEDTYEAATALLKRADSQLVLLHVTSIDDAGHVSSGSTVATAEPRWHKLACALPAGRTFVDAVAGDPTFEIAAEAERFHPDAVLL